MYHAYIIQLSDNSFYHGSSTNLTDRIKAHQSGSVESTKNLRPIKLVFYAAFTSKKLATDFEDYLKTTSGWAFRNKRLIDN